MIAWIGYVPLTLRNKFDLLGQVSGLDFLLVRYRLMMHRYGIPVIGFCLVS